MATITAAVCFVIVVYVSIRILKNIAAKRRMRKRAQEMLAEKYPWEDFSR